MLLRGSSSIGGGADCVQSLSTMRRGCQSTRYTPPREWKRSLGVEVLRGRGPPPAVLSRADACITTFLDSVQAVRYLESEEQTANSNYLLGFGLSVARLRVSALSTQPSPVTITHNM